MQLPIIPIACSTCESLLPAAATKSLDPWLSSLVKAHVEGCVECDVKFLEISAAENAVASGPTEEEILQIASELLRRLPK